MAGTPPYREVGKGFCWHLLDWSMLKRDIEIMLLLDISVGLIAQVVRALH